MFKKYLYLVSMLAMVLCSSGYAGSVYFGPSLFLSDNMANNSNYRGIHPRMSLGYATMLQDLYLAGEIFAVPFSATIDDNRKGGAVSARSTRSVGISLLPGGMINDHVLGYFRLGGVSTLFPGPNTTRTAFQAGLGLQTALSPYWDLRAEYIYSAYNSVPGLGSLKTDQVGLGLVYKVLANECF